MKRKESFVCLLKVVEAQRYCLGRNTAVECSISPIRFENIRKCSINTSTNVEISFPYEYCKQVWNVS